MSALLGVRQAIETFGDSFERIETLAQSLALAVDTKGRYTPSHSHAVSKISMTIAATIGIDGDELARLRLAGLLHDVGKLVIPDSILLKPGRLTESEYDVIKEHPVRGHDLLIALGLRDEARWVLHHHERLDGTGYPTCLTGISIPLASRILAIADAYDVMTSTRVYQGAVSPSDAIAELRRCSAQFDRDLVEAFAALLADTEAVEQLPL